MGRLRFGELRKIVTRKGHMCELCDNWIRSGSTAYVRRDGDPNVGGGMHYLPDAYRHKRCEGRRQHAENERRADLRRKRRSTKAAAKGGER